MAESSASLATPAAAESRPRRRRPDSRPSPSARLRRQRIRLVYFGLASLWGFLIAAATILGGLVFVGHPLQLTPGVGGLLATAALLAALGGGVASQAYRQAVGRLR